MIVLGIDPGSVRIGYGLIASEKGLLSLIASGILKIRSKDSAGQILEASKEIAKLIKKYRPALAGIEKLYFAKNVKTGIAVAQTRGALILELAKNRLPVKELSPSEVKLAVAGYGLADKKSIAKMVSLILRLPKEKLWAYDDSTDALAIAIAAVNNIIKGS